MGNADRVGNEVLGPRLLQLKEEYPVIGEVRGKGMFWAVELVEDRDTRQPLSDAKMGQLKASLIDKGLLSFIVNNRIHVVPPLVVRPDEIERGVAILAECLALLDS